ncbi:MAG: lipoate--protein ligase family protein [Candidatus Micrarchaeia archaeon]
MNKYDYNLKLFYFGHSKSNIFNMAVDEAIFQNLMRGEIIVRTYEFENNAIIIGRNDNISNILNFEENKKKIEITRRETGGMPIFVGDKTFSFSIIGSTSIFSDKSLKLTVELHKFFGNAIANAIRSLGNNDIRIEVGDKYSIKLNGKPIAGQSSLIENNKFIYHGVITIEKLDADKIKNFILLKDGDYDKLISLPALGNFFLNTDIKEHLKSTIPNEVSKLLRLDLVDLAKSDIKKYQEILKYAEQLNIEKYQNEEWVIGDKNKGKSGRGYCLLYGD